MRLSDGDIRALGLDPGLQLSDHVFLRETVCRCGKCGLWRVQVDTLKLFDGGREAWGGPIQISSGARCRAWQRRVNPGSVHSLHVAEPDGQGYALDLLLPFGAKLAAFHRHWQGIADAYPTVGLGLYKWGVHIDVPPAGRGVTPKRRWKG